MKIFSLFLLFPLLSVGQAISDETTIQGGLWDGLDVTIESWPVSEPTLYDAERKNDTLYLYYKEYRTYNVSCAVYGCTENHNAPSKYRVAFFWDKGKIEKGEKQYPKHERVEKIIYEEIEKW
jgi:hypothetical protein